MSNENQTGLPVTIDVNSLERPVTFGFGRAVDVLREGKKVARASWPKTAYLRLVNTAGVEITQTITGFSAEAPDGVEYPPNQEDVMANDWMEVL